MRVGSTLWQRLRKRLRPPRRLTFTREGKLVTVLAIGIGFAAVNTGNNLLYLLLGWLLSFIIASGILSEQTLRGLRVSRRPPPRVHAGTPFLMELVIENTKATRASYSIEVEDLVDPTASPFGDAASKRSLLGAVTPLDKRCYFLKVPPAKTQRTNYRHTFSRRGMHVLTGYRLATKFPFSLFRKSRDVDAPLEVLVYPTARPTPKTMNRGETSSARIGRRGEFHGLRERRTGDDRRDIHWRSSARTGRLLVREYEDELAQRVIIGVDNALPEAVRHAVADGALTPPVEAQVAAVERAISVASSLAASYLESGWTVELVARGAHVPAGAGRMHEAVIAKALALLPYAGDDVAFPVIPPRVESVLVTARGVAAGNRPMASTVMDV